MQIDKLLTTFLILWGLMHKAQSRIRDLSGRSGQRAAIAQALVNKPELLILDEPLANLDIASNILLLNCLQSLINVLV